MKLSPSIGLTLTTALSALLFSTAARADDVVFQTDSVTTSRPNASLLRSGIWTLGLSYVPAVVVAAESSLPADDNLYIPVAGPWLDYAERDCPECSHETLNKVLLVTDGIFQGVGALEILGAFIFWETKTQSTASSPADVAQANQVRFRPARLAGGSYGLRAEGTF